MPESQPGSHGGHSFKAVAEEWRENWRTGVASMIGLGLCSSAGATVFSMFIQPLEEHFGWSRGEISAAKSATIFIALLAPFIGRLLDMRGVRRPLLFSMAGMGLCYLLLATMQGPLWQFYLLIAALLIVGVPTSGIGFGRVISAVFVKSRGFSLAAGRSGMAISGALLPPLLYFAISEFGWRAGYVTMAALVLLVALPAAWAWIETGRKAQQAAATKLLPLRALLSDWRIPAVALAAGLAYMPILAIISQLQALLTEHGIAPGTAASMLGLIGIATLVGTLGTGLLIDRIWAPMIAFPMMCLAAIGALLLVFSNGDLTMVVIGIILLGLGQGAEHDLVAFMVARYFGVANFSGIFGVTVLAVSGMAAIGYSAIGFSHDLTGNYDLALYCAAASLFLSGLLYLTLGAYPSDPDNREGEPAAA